MASDAYEALVNAAVEAQIAECNNEVGPLLHGVMQAQFKTGLDAILSARLTKRCETCSPRCGQTIRGLYGAVTTCQRKYGHAEPHTVNDGIAHCEACHGAGTVPGNLAIIDALIERGVLEKRGYDDKNGDPYLWDVGDEADALYRVVDAPVEETT